MDIKQKLNQLYELEKKVDQFKAQRDHAVEELIGPKLLGQIDELRKTFDEKLELFAVESNRLKNEIKENVLASGKTTTGDYIKAQYVRGRKTWDSKGLSGYAVHDPKVKQFLKIGKPSVRFSKVK